MSAGGLFTSNQLRAVVIPCERCRLFGGRRRHVPGTQQQICGDHLPWRAERHGRRRLPDLSNEYLNVLTSAGHFAFICNHGRGHTIPTDAVPSVIEFFYAHPYGTDPSPYAGGLLLDFRLLHALTRSSTG